jgi:AraC-like DNA-binding protein
MFFNNIFFSPVQRKSPFRSLESTLTFLHENFHRNVSLAEMAEQAGLSVTHFSFLFKQQTGYSPVDYFIHVKMQRACTLLTLQPKTINEIAYELGYEDPYYFSRIFKKVVGVSPNYYRATTVSYNSEPEV